MDWLRTAAAHVERIEALLLANYQLSRAQLDALWTYVGHDLMAQLKARGHRRILKG